MPLLQKSTMTYYVSKLLKHLLLCIIITITPIFITKTPVVASLACFHGLCGTPYRTNNQNDAMATSLPWSISRSILLQWFDFKAMIFVSFHDHQAVTEVIILFHDTSLHISTELEGLSEFASLTSTVRNANFGMSLVLDLCQCFCEKRSCAGAQYKTNPVVGGNKFTHTLKL